MQINAIKNSLYKYIHSYAYLPKHLPLITQAVGSILPQFSQFCVCPSMGEPSLFLLIDDLEQSSKHQSEKNLLVLIINEKTSTPRYLKKINRDFFNIFFIQNPLEPFYFFDYSDHLSLLILNNTTLTTPLREEEGVGHIRRMGFDTLLYLLYTLDPDINNEAWTHEVFFSIDADARVDTNYFLRKKSIDPTNKPGLYPSTNYPCLFFSFQHYPIPTDPPATQKAGLHYDTFLTTTYQGLTEARSPYRTPMLGSILCFSPLLYLLVRGIPKRKGGEDFYFINKILKISHACFTSQTVVELPLRLSTRTPYGTGASIAKIETSKKNPFYSQKSFELLKILMSVTEPFLSYEEKMGGHSLSPLLVSLVDDLLRPQKNVSWGRRLQDKSPWTQREYISFHSQFDALKTYQFLHKCSLKN